MRITRTIAPLVLATVLIGGLAACTAPAPVDTKPTSESESGSEATESPSGPVTVGDYVTADWAKPVTNPGELLTSIVGDGFQVDVYQVGVTQATKTGNFANPDTNKPIIEVGADIVFVNFIVTNTGDADIPLSYSVVDVSPRYADWPYLQGMDSVTDFSLNDQMKINETAIAVGGPDAPFAWAPGTSFSYGTNFLYEKGGAITFAASLTPSLPNGDLDHDKGQDVSADSVIK